MTTRTCYTSQADLIVRSSYRGLLGGPIIGRRVWRRYALSDPEILKSGEAAEDNVIECISPVVIYRKTKN